MLGVSIVLFVVLLAVLFAVAAVTAGFGDLMRPVFQDARPVGMPEGRVAPGDLDALRFNVVLRGYKMAEVDAVLQRMAREIGERDAVLAELRGERQPSPPDAPPAPAPYDELTAPLPVLEEPVLEEPDHLADTDEHPAVVDEPAAALPEPPEAPQPLD